MKFLFCNIAPNDYKSINCKWNIDLALYYLIKKELDLDSSSHSITPFKHN